MRTPWTWRLLFILAVAAAGCGGESREPVLLTVGDQEVTLAEFERAFEDLLRQEDGYERDSLSAHRFLNDYISKTLMEQVAADSIPWTFDLEHRVESSLETQMVHKLRQDTYGEATRIDDEDVRAVYEKARTRYHFRAIAFNTEAEAVRNLRLIREGAHFPKVADRVSGQGTGGDAGWQSALEIPEVIIDLLAELEPNEVGGPVEAAGRYHLVQLLESEPNRALPPFEQVKHGLRMRVIQDRGTGLLNAFHQHLYEKYEFTPRMDQVLWMTEFFHEATKDVVRGLDIESLRGEDGELSEPIPSRVPWDECPLPRDQFDRIIATTSVDTITAVLMFDHLMSKLSYTWPRFETPDDVMFLLRELVRQRLERVEAWELGYDKDPELAWRAQKLRGLIHTRQFYLRKIRARTRPSLEEARAWYYTQVAPAPERRRYTMFVVRDWDTAVAAREILLSVTDTDEAFAQVKRRDPDATSIGADGFTVSADQVSSPLDRQVFRLDPGGVTDPVPVGNRFGVARVEEIVAGSALPFEDVAEQVIARLNEIRADSLLNVILDERRAVTPIHVDEAVFARIDYTE